MARKTPGTCLGHAALNINTRLIRDFSKDKEKGQKFDPNCIGPRCLIEITKSGTSAFTRDFYGVRRDRHYHLNDIKIFCMRDSLEIGNWKLQ